MITSYYSIIVNSSDDFEDCWVPFFTLLKKNWDNCNAPIFLNTEHKTFQFSGLKIYVTQSHRLVNDRKLTWSECLINALNLVETPLVLYLQEDYFIQSPVKFEIINDFVNLMISDKSIKHIGLTHFGSKGPFTFFENDFRLLKIKKDAEYRISTQAGLWDRGTLLSYLRPDENGWMFEIFGSKRSSKKNDIFLTANKQIFNSVNAYIIDYIHTGIIKGKWHKSIPQLFEQNNIKINFNKRGFYKSRPIFIRKIQTLIKLLKNPIKFLNSVFGR